MQSQVHVQMQESSTLLCMLGAGECHLKGIGVVLVSS